MKIEKASNPWASKYPMFRCPTWKDYEEACKWMNENKVEHFLWSSGSGGYTFDVREGRVWFLLRWS